MDSTTIRKPEITILIQRGENNMRAFAFAVDDGMLIGAIEMGGTVTRYGENPQMIETRYWKNEECALAYMKNKCRDYLVRADVTFFIEEVQPLVVGANQMPKRRM